MNYIKPYLGRIICTALGLASAISFLTLGFFKTTLILICCGIGYAAGMCKDKVVNPLEIIKFLRDKL